MNFIRWFCSGSVYGLQVRKESKYSLRWEAGRCRYHVLVRGAFYRVRSNYLNKKRIIHGGSKHERVRMYSKLKVKVNCRECSKEVINAPAVHVKGVNGKIADSIQSFIALSASTILKTCLLRISMLPGWSEPKVCIYLLPIPLYPLNRHGRVQSRND